MCHDLSFSSRTVEYITDLLPDIIFDSQIDIDFSVTAHVLSMSNRNCLAVYSKEGKPHLTKFEWGLIADFMKTPDLIKKYRIQMANARSENIFDKKSSWNRIRNNRCLIAVNGIYEHRKVQGFKNKIPYYIQLKKSKLMLIPALFNYSPLPDMETGEMTGTFSIITRDANKVMSLIHNDGTNKHRMPVFMPPGIALQWIDETLTDQEVKDILDYEIPSEDLTTYPVYMIRTTKERPDGKEKFEEFKYENLPELGVDSVDGGKLF